jgi:type IV pilus assembly protein PilW
MRLTQHIVNKVRNTARGFGILELMIAMAISLLLLAGVSTLFVSSKSTYETIDRLSRVQENGRFALDEMVSDVRSAGYPGCARAVRAWHSTVNTPAALPWNFDQLVAGFEADSASTWAPSLDASVVSATPGNDVLVLRVPKRNAPSVRLSNTLATRTADVVVPNTNPAPFASGDLVKLMSCDAQTIFQVTGYSAGTISHALSSATVTAPGNVTNDLGYLFKAGAEIIPVNTVVYYVRTGTAGDSLWRRIGTNTPEELVEGIDGMQVLYGVNTDDDADHTADDYQTAKDVENNNLWGRVVSVKVALLARSINEYGSNTDSKTYSLLGTLGATLGPYNDRRLREVFTSTITIRNRAS